MDNQRKNTRRIPDDYFLVFNRESEEFIGRVTNMSTDGMMLVSEHPVEVSRVFPCRMALPKKIDGCNQVMFNAESKWCQQNEKTKMYEAGYEFMRIDKKDRNVIKVLLQKWLVFQAPSLSSWTS